MSSPGILTLFGSVRSRVLPYLAYWWFVWPLATIFFGAMVMTTHPLTPGMPFTYALAAIAGGELEMMPEFMVVGGMIALASAAAMGGLSRALSMRRRGRFFYLLEAVLVMIALSFAVALEYPTILNNKALGYFAMWRVGALYALLGAGVGIFALAMGYRAARFRGAVAYLLMITAFVAAMWNVVRQPAEQVATRSAAHSAYLIGLDSISQEMDIAPLKQFTAAHGGQWYTHAVTPGLLTNSVWPSIVMHRPVHEAGTFLTYQHPDWSRSPYNLITAFKGAGYSTYSYFSDQFTAYTGSVGGFDHDHSGPRGWHQLATAVAKNASVLLPIILPRMPHIPFSATPPNQSGTFAFDLDRELREIFATAPEGRNFVAAHIDYLHQPTYPRFAQLTAAERARVYRARVASVRDFSLHWQYPAVVGEPIGLYDWKLANLQRSLARAMENAGVLAAERKNVVVLFSDHGNRSGITNATFGKAAYYRVPLVVFGSATKFKEDEPISLLDIPELMNMPDASRPGRAEPAVEYVNVETAEAWRDMIQRSRLNSDGDIDLPPAYVLQYGRLLKAYRPYAGSGEYADTPIVIK